MTKTQLELASISMDLKRVALGYERNSNAMALKFSQEAQRRIRNLDHSYLKPYVKKLLLNLENVLLQEDTQKVAEDALMYSTLLQNCVAS